MSVHANEDHPIVVIDIGKPSGSLAWVYGDGGEHPRLHGDKCCEEGGAHKPHVCIGCLRCFLRERLEKGPVELGVEAPLLIPLPFAKGRSKADLHMRPFEIQRENAGVHLKSRPWYSGSGATTLSMSLALLTYLFRGLQTSVSTEPAKGKLWLWEAMVSRLEEPRLESALDAFTMLKGAQAHRKDVAAAGLGYRARLEEGCEADLFPEGLEVSEDTLNIVEVAAKAAGIRFEGKRHALSVYDASGLDLDGGDA